MVGAEMTLSDIKEVTVIATAILSGCLFIFRAIVKHTQSFEHLIGNLKFELRQLSSAVTDVKDVLHNELVPKVNDHGERIRALETRYTNGKQ